MAQNTLPKLPKTMQNSPNQNLLYWLGYFAKREKTMMPSNALTRGTINCFIPDGDKIVPRTGSQLFGQASTDNVGIMGHKKKYKNLGGIEMEVRAYHSGDANLKDVIEVQYNDVFVPITQSVNPIPATPSTNRFYFDVFYDSDLNQSSGKRLSRLVWVNNYQDPSTKKGAIYSWTGGIGTISVVTVTDLTITGGTWRELGFSENASGNVFIVVNGTAHQVTTPADIDTDTVTIASTAGIVAGDIATSQIETDIVDTPMENCKATKNYMFYGNSKEQRFFQSNQFNHPSTTTFAGTNAVQNDLIISGSANFTGTGSNQYKITIDSIDPATETQTFTGTGTGNGTFNTSGYTGVGNNSYKLVAVTDYIITGITASMVPAAGNPAWIDQVFVGGTSGAIGVAIGGQYAVSFVAPMRMTSGAFLIGEVITGQSTGAAVTVLASQTANFFQLFKNGTQITSIPFNNAPQYMVQADLNGTPISSTITLTDGITFTFPNPTQCNPGDFYTLTKNAGGVDRFIWQKNNGTASSPISITGADQTLELGVIIRFLKTTGHAVGDYWILQADQKITRAWANFYYTLDTSTQQSLRKPGEGYIYNLPSNFWAMGCLEDSLFINSSYGEWGYINPVLSGDLKSETVVYTPLKKAGANKVIFPYMIGNSQNDLLFINENKQLDSIGRIQLTEKLQIDYISDPVKNDFLDASFVNGSIEFQDKKIWITSPEDFIMFCYDDYKEYWQPPQVIPENAMLTVIGNQLCSHSNVTNSTRSILDPTAVGDDGAIYKVVIQTSIYDYGSRWAKKSSNETFFEAYIHLPAIMKLAVLLDVDEPDRTREHTIIPVYGSDTTLIAPFGGGSMGSHSMGSDEITQTAYARELYKKLGDITYYFASMRFTCDTDRHQYEILSMGLNMVASKSNNNQWVDRTDVESPENILLPL